jgi:hypothetical protein
MATVLAPPRQDTCYKNIPYLLFPPKPQFMKKLFLLLLVYGMYISAFAQPGIPKKNIADSSDKWEIIKGGTKSSTGKLFVTLPKGTAWDMTIYAAGTDKVISNTMLKTSFTLPPGKYDLEINHIRISGVPVEKGSNTRIKAGLLKITTSGSWTLYNETKETVLINTYSEQTRGLPVGKYKLAIMGQDQDIEIADEPSGQENTGTNETDRWVITPLAAMTDGIGKLSIIIPKDTTVIVIDHPVTIPYNIRDTVRIIQTGYNYTIIHLPKYLSTRSSYSISLNNIKFTAPVKSGMETRIKAGYLMVTKKVTEAYNPNDFLSELNDHIWGSNDFPDVTWKWSLSGTYGTLKGKGGGTYALPPGEYHLTKFNPNPNKDDLHYLITIKDGEWVKNGVKQ